MRQPDAEQFYLAPGPAAPSPPSSAMQRAGAVGSGTQRSPSRWGAIRPAKGGSGIGPEDLRVEHPKVVATQQGALGLMKVVPEGLSTDSDGRLSGRQNGLLPWPPWHHRGV